MTHHCWRPLQVVWQSHGTRADTSNAPHLHSESEPFIKNAGSNTYKNQRQENYLSSPTILELCYLLLADMENISVWWGERGFLSDPRAQGEKLKLKWIIFGLSCDICLILVFLCAAASNNVALPLSKPVTPRLDPQLHPFCPIDLWCLSLEFWLDCWGRPLFPSHVCMVGSLFGEPAEATGWNDENVGLENLSEKI